MSRTPAPQAAARRHMQCRAPLTQSPTKPSCASARSRQRRTAAIPMITKSPTSASSAKAAVAGLAGQGLVVAAKDKFPHDGNSFSYVASFAEVEVDVETGKYFITD